MSDVSKSMGKMDSSALDPVLLVKEINKLVSLPTVSIKVNQMVDENAAAREIGQAISTDVDLTSRLLKIANSSFYGFTSKIETISRAITIIGDNELRSLVLATATVEAFENFPIDIAYMANFWKHSLNCGIVSRLIAKQRGIKHNEQIFVAGLLHDIGHLVLFQKCADLEKQCMVTAALMNEELHLVEKNILGFDHAYIGGLLLNEWNLPSSLVEPVMHHHDPAAVEKYKLEASIVHIANIVSKNLQNKEYAVPFDRLNIDYVIADMVGFTEEKYLQIKTELPSLYTSAVELFLSDEIVNA